MGICMCVNPHPHCPCGNGGYPPWHGPYGFPSPYGPYGPYDGPTAPYRPTPPYITPRPHRRRRYPVGRRDYYWYPYEYSVGIRTITSVPSVFNSDVCLDQRIKNYDPQIDEYNKQINELKNIQNKEKEKAEEEMNAKFARQIAELMAKQRLERQGTTCPEGQKGDEGEDGLDADKEEKAAIGKQAPNPFFGRGPDGAG